MACRQERINPRLDLRLHCTRVQLTEAEIEHIFKTVRNCREVTETALKIKFKKEMKRLLAMLKHV